jgi:predicted RNA polymerase sigma factor
MIKEGVELLGLALRRCQHQPNTYVIQAAISACHALAAAYADTNWGAIVSWYDTLLTVQDTSVIRLNRAVAVAERDGPQAGLSLIDAIGDLQKHSWWHAARAELLRRMGQPPRHVRHTKKRSRSRGMRRKPNTCADASTS